MWMYFKHQTSAVPETAEYSFLWLTTIQMFKKTTRKTKFVLSSLAYNVTHKQQ